MPSCKIAARGLLISQFLPGSAPTKVSFPMRNAVMSGYALATIVVEAAYRSGARMQARLALQHGRHVFLMRSLLEHHLVPVLPQGRLRLLNMLDGGGSRLCDCFQCHNARGAYGRRLADIVVPIALAVKREQLAHELWPYKYDADARARATGGAARKRAVLMLGHVE